MENLVSTTNRKLVKLFDRDDVAIYNSIPTVEGTLMMVIQHTDYTIHGSNVMVLGFGRTGMSVARAFQSLGAHVKVGARRSEHIARITEMMFSPFHMQDIEKEVGNIDIVINTIPHLVVTANVIAKMPAHTLVIDLASKPGGTDFRYAEKESQSIASTWITRYCCPKNGWANLSKCSFSFISSRCNRKGGGKEMSLKGKRWFRIYRFTLYV